MKRKLIKISVLFLGLMILFTILSRAAYNLTVPRVTVEKPSSAQIGPVVEGQGTVSEKQDLPVVTVEGQLIRSVYVTEGQAVDPGTPLYQIDLKKLDENISKKQQQIEAIDLQNESAQSARDVARQAKELSQSQAKADYDRAAADGDAAVSQAQNDLTQATEQYQDYKADPASHPDQSEEELSKAVADKQAAYDAAVKSRDDSLYNAQKAIDSANIDTSKDTSIQQADLNKQQLQKDLDKLNALKNAKGVVASPVKGVVTQVAAKTGQATTGAGDILLADTGAGVKLTANFAAENKKYLYRGEKVAISSQNTDPKIADKLKDLTITAIADSGGPGGPMAAGGSAAAQGPADAGNGASPANGSASADEKGGSGVTVTINLPPDSLDMGNAATVKVKTDSKVYDTCVPYGALHKDNGKEYYVLVIENTKSVLGKELVVRKVNVSLLQKSEKFAAVDGISSTQEVVTESTRELSDGTRVKRKEE